MATKVFARSQGRKARPVVVCGAVVIAVLAIVLVPKQARAHSEMYACFFAKGSVSPTDRCMKIVDEFATRWKLIRDGRYRVPGTAVEIPPAVTQVEVQGSAQDDASTVDADQKLSIERAARVAALLEAAGVPSYVIHVSGYGRERLLLPDADDPQNRYVMIMRR